MSRFLAADYEDAFDDYEDYGDYDDDEDDCQISAPRTKAIKQPPAKKTEQKQSIARKQQNTPPPKVNAVVSRKGQGVGRETTVESCADGSDSAAVAPSRKTEGPVRLPLSEYKIEPALLRLCEDTVEVDGVARSTLHLVILGHVDAGKSTLMGRLLHDLGLVNQKTVRKNEKEATQLGKASFSWAWVLDERPDERARGLTVDVATSRFQTEKFDVVLLDAPGHRDFVPNMISGAAQADAAILAVDGSTNGFESGFQQKGTSSSPSGGGQTREHAQLARSLGIEQLAVVVTKLDTCASSQERFDEIKLQLLPFLLQCGFKKGSIQWLMCSAPSGVNVTTPPVSEESTLSWFKGSTVLEAINKFHPVAKNIDFPLRCSVVDVPASKSVGDVTVSGKIEAGAAQIGSKIVIMPSGETTTVKSITVNGEIRQFVKAGGSCEMTLMDVVPKALFPGCVLCTEGWPCPVTSRFECRVIVLDPPTPIIPGIQVSLQAHAVRESGDIARLVSLLNAKTGEVVKTRPRCLSAGQTAVVEVTASKPICIEEYSITRALGRITLRESGRTIAVGIIVKIY